MENRWSGTKSVIGMEPQRFNLICAEGISRAGMLAFQFGAAREREKLAKRVSHRLSSKDGIEYGIEHGRREGIETEIAHGRQEMILSIDKLIKSLGVTKEQACEIMGLELLEYESALMG